MEGVHYVHGWGELGLMIEKYGMDHKPYLLQHSCPLPSKKKKTLKELHSEYYTEQGVAATSTNATASDKPSDKTCENYLKLYHVIV